MLQSNVVGKRTRKKKANEYAASIISSNSSTSKISTKALQHMRDDLQNSKHRPSTKENYHGVWRTFNAFVIMLDKIPSSWEERTSLYCTYLIRVKGLQSSTVKSYVSAIKDKLVSDGYQWSDEKVLLSSLTKACKIENDELCDRLPIQKSLMEMIIFEMERIYPSQIKNTRLYEEILFKCLYAITYYGLFRVSEVTKSDHVVKAVDVLKTNDGKKFLFILRSSKTHDKRHRPQKIRIEPNTNKKPRSGKFFCPVQLTIEYLEVRPLIHDTQEQFFIFRDGSPVTATQMRSTLKLALRNLHLDPDLYDTHSFRIGRATDLQKLNTPVDTIKALGRWKSNAVYNYLRRF